MAAVVDEISADTRLMLIELAEGFAEGMRKNTVNLSEGSGKALANWAEGVMHPDRCRMVSEIPWKNITEACALLGITPQTFRKYVRQGHIPKGHKRQGYREPVWQKEEIESFRDWYVSHRRKR